MQKINIAMLATQKQVRGIYDKTWIDSVIKCLIADDVTVLNSAFTMMFFRVQTFEYMY